MFANKIQNKTFGKEFVIKELIKKQKMKISPLLGLALLISSTSIAQNLQNAIKNTDNELFTESEKEFKQLIEKEPVNGCYYFYLGENFFAQKENDSALYYWQKAFEKDPENPLSFVSLGKAMWVRGESASAKEKFAKALATTKSKNAEVLRNIAKTYITAQNTNYDEAINLLNLAIKLEPKNEDNHILMGDALLGKTPENANSAIKSYNKVLDINPKSARGIVRVGKLYQRVNADSLANSYYQDAQKIDPSYAPAYRENAELFLNINRPKPAIENWKKYLELNNSIEARYRFATALFSGKQYCDAINEINDLQQKGFSNFYTKRMLVYSYAECTTDKEAPAKGLAASEEFFKIVPQDKINYQDYKYKGLLLLNAGQDSLAIIELEKVSTMDENAKKELAGQIGKMYLKAKNYTKTIEFYEYKKESSSLTATEYFELGRAYYVGPGDYVKADSSFSALSRLSPSFTAAYFWRGRSNFQLDSKNEKWLAKPFYEKTFDMIKPEERLTGNNKSMTLESGQYMGNYYYNSPEKDLEKAKIYWKAVLEVDPNDAAAKAFFSKVK